MPVPPGMYKGRGKVRRTGDLPLGKGFDWTRMRTTPPVERAVVMSRLVPFQTLQQFRWLPQHARTSPVRHHPPSSFSRTPASFLADQPDFKLLTSKTYKAVDGSPLFESKHCNPHSTQGYAHVLMPAGLHEGLPKAAETLLSPLRSINGYRGVWN